MLRSFSYARGSIEIRERVPALGEWEKQTREVVREGVRRRHRRKRLYESFDDVRGLLRLAEMEKVLYELRYERSNRPNWLHIPLQGLTALLQGGLRWTLRSDARAGARVPAPGRRPAAAPRLALVI
jgi:maltose alpha-D-glucosyltransferase/alpha-amylase